MGPSETSTIDEQPTVLLEHEDGAMRWAATDALRAAGFGVEACGGPAERPCPLLLAGTCQKAWRADVIIAGLPPARAAVLERLHDYVPNTPKLLLATDRDRERLGELAEGCGQVWPWATASQLVATVETATR